MSGRWRVVPSLLLFKKERLHKSFKKERLQRAPQDFSW